MGDRFPGLPRKFAMLLTATNARTLDAANSSNGDVSAGTTQLAYLKPLFWYSLM